MTDWGVLGGQDPAPGSIQSVQQVAGAFRRVERDAADIHSNLSSMVSKVGPDVWSGLGATAFHDKAKTLPPDLANASESFGAAASALERYETVLESSQHRAMNLLTTAEEVSHRLDQAKASLKDAKALKSREEAALATAQRDLFLLKGQQALAVDPVQQADLARRVTTQSSLVAQRQRSVDETAGEIRSLEASRRQLQSELDGYKQDADTLANTVRQAAERAVSELRDAERQADLPSWETRTWTDTEETIALYGPVVADSLELGTTLFSVAGKVFPPGAAVFSVCALVCGGLSIGVNLASAECSPEGMTTAKLIHIGGSALSMAATACGMPAAESGAAAGWSVAAKLFTFSSSASGVAEAGVKDGVKGVETQLISLGIGFGVAKLADVGFSKLAKSPVMSGVLNSISKNIRSSADGTGKIGALTVPANDSRALQSCLSVNVPPGGFMIGNHASLNPSLIDHALPAAAAPQLGDAAGDLVQNLSAHLMDPSASQASTGVQGPTTTDSVAGPTEGWLQL